MATTLSPSQSAALFDILTHYNTYAEICDFRQLGSFTHYGPPFTIAASRPSTSPSLQSLVSKFLLNLPGLRDVSPDLWRIQIHALIEQLELANLSESYDKGVIGSRKTLSTAISALIEYPVRGTAGGFPKIPEGDRWGEYDVGKAEDLARAFREFMDQAIYGDVLEELIVKTAETDRLAEHEVLTQAVHEFILVNVASFMHYTLILSPKGQYLLKLLGNANKLVPYMVIRQTLKIGNVASMISAMMKVVLAKMSVASITNWIGLTSSEEVGLNLMQHIISTVLHWDLRDLESRATRIEADKESLSKEQIACLKRYVNSSPEEQAKVRDQSENSSISIIISILATSELPTDLPEQTHALALEYLANLLSIRDRKEIIRVLCRSSPDHLTTIVRTLVSAYEPVIRNIHNAVDLSDSVSDFQNFLSDMLKMSKIPPPDRSGEVTVPTVGDFVQLLKKHQYSCHKFLHQCAKNGKELTGWYREWLKSAASKFRRDTSSTVSDPTIRDAGHLNQPLNEIISSLPAQKQEQLLPILEAHSAYLDEMHSASKIRLDILLHSPQSKNPAMAKVLASSTNSSRASSRPASPDPGARTPVTPVVTLGPGREKDGQVGPGAYLARWQDLLDGTALTPLTATGDSGANVGSQEKVGSGGKESGKPDVQPVIEAMGKEFRDLLGKRGLYW